MAYTVPDGSKLFISTVLAAAIPVTALSNANPAVASADAHGLLDGKEFILFSGWDDASNRVFRAADKTADSFAIEGLDTTSPKRFSAGGGLGSVVPVTTWQEIQQVLNPASSGGDPKYADVDPLGSMYAVQIPAGFSATSITIPIGDDPSLPGYKALKKVSDERTLVVLKVQKPAGGVNYFYGYAALNENPSMTKGQVDTVTAYFAPQGLTTRYPA